MKVLETLELIRWLVLDVDGTMTDGGIYLDGNGIETKKFTVQDGAGILLKVRQGARVKKGAVFRRAFAFVPLL